MINAFSNFAIFQFLVRKRSRRRGSSRARFHIGGSNPIVELGFAANTLPAKRIDRNIGHDAVKPRIKRGFPLKPMNRFPGFQESLLSEIPSVLLIFYHPLDHSKNFATITGDQIVEAARISSLTPFHQLNVAWLSCINRTVTRLKLRRACLYFIQWEFFLIARGLRDHNACAIPRANPPSSQ